MDININAKRHVYYHRTKRNNSTRELSRFMAAARKNQPEHDPKNSVQQKLYSKHTVMCMDFNFKGPSYEYVWTFLVNGAGSERPTCVRAECARADQGKYRSSLTSSSNSHKCLVTVLSVSYDDPSPYREAIGKRPNADLYLRILGQLDYKGKIGLGNQACAGPRRTVGSLGSSCA